MPMCGVMGDAELFDYFLDLQLVAQALAGIPAQYPFPTNYATTIAPAIRAAFGTPYPVALTPPGRQYAAVVQQLTGGTRANFATAFGFWGNALLGFALPGDFGGTPGRAVGNVDTIYQIDNDPALTAAEQALNSIVLRVTDATLRRRRERDTQRARREASDMQLRMPRTATGEDGVAPDGRRLEDGAADA